MTETRRLISIDALRGMAAIAVVFRHLLHFGALQERHTFRLPAYLMDLGYLGVPLFVVISGFCIHRRAAIKGARNVSWINFWKRRFWRLYPPYVVAMSLSLAVGIWIAPFLLVAPDALGTDSIAHFAMVHNLSERYQFGMGNAAFWSLGMEEQLYALYAILIVLLVRGGWRIALGVVATTAVAWASWIVVAGEDFPGTFFLNQWWFWPFMWWLLWTLGALSVEAAVGLRRLPNWASSWRVALALTALAIATNRETARELVRRFPGLSGELAQCVYMLSEIVVGVAFFVFLNWFVALERKGAHFPSVVTWLSSIGVFSYSIYLMHIPTISAIRVLVFNDLPTCHWMLSSTLYFCASILAGWVFFQLVERRFLVHSTSENRAPAVAHS